MSLDEKSLSHLIPRTCLLTCKLGGSRFKGRVPAELRKGAMTHLQTPPLPQRHHQISVCLLWGHREGHYSFLPSGTAMDGAIMLS